MYSVLNTEYTLRMCIFLHTKNITSYTLLLVFKIVESLQCILKNLMAVFAREDDDSCLFFLNRVAGLILLPIVW